MTEHAAQAAARMRDSRDGLVRGIRDGTIDLATVPDGPDVNRVKVVVLAEAVPEVGKVLARRILDELGLAHGTRWGELDARKAALVEALKGGGASPASGR